MTSPRKLHARPLCALCQAPVEAFTEEDGEGVLAGYVLFVARCHGEVERQKLPRSWASGLNFGMAFIPPNRLPEPDTFSNRLTGPGITSEGLERAAWKLRRLATPRRTP